MTSNEYFEQLDLDILNNNIYNFMNMDFLNATIAEIQNNYLLCLTQKGLMEYPLELYALTFPIGKKLYRIRADIKEFDDLDNISKQTFSYNPNPKIGRFNSDNEKVLYTSTNILTSMEEANIKIGDKFLYIEYEIVKELKLRILEVNNRYHALNNEYAEKIGAINSFLNELMVISTSINESAHKLSNILKNLPPYLLSDDIVGWLYSSTKTDGPINMNVALAYPKAEGYLMLNNFYIAKRNSETSIELESIRLIEEAISKSPDAERII